LLAAAARDAEQQPFLMAALLANYRTQTGLADNALAAQLQCSMVALHGLALCRQPAPTAPDFVLQVTAVGAYVGCDALVLQRLIEGQGGTRMTPMISLQVCCPHCDQRFWVLPQERSLPPHARRSDRGTVPCFGRVGHLLA
jgi:hypothetical protein